MKIADQLQGFGLSEKEARVYAASLSHGKATIDTLAKTAGILRTTTYTQVARLQELGLLSMITIGKKTYYVPESPENILRLIERQKRELSQQEGTFHDLLPALLNSFKLHNKRPTVRFFQGKDGLLTMRNEVLDHATDELLVASSYDLFAKTFSQTERDSFTKRRRDKGVRLRGLFTSQKPKSVLTAASDLEEVRELPYDAVELLFDIYITGDHVYISSLGDDVWGLAIDSHAVAASMTSLFKMAWEYAAWRQILTKETST